MAKLPRVTGWRKLGPPVRERVLGLARVHLV